jgi:hypothetical protein
MKQQSFDLNTSLAKLVLAWKVPTVAGANCLALSNYVNYVGTVIGLGAFDARPIIASAMRDASGLVDISSIKPNVGVVGTYNLGYFKDAQREWLLQFLDSNGSRNAFEAALVFTPIGGATWYMPGGVVGRTRAYKDTGTGPGQKGTDKVITVMRELAWTSRLTGQIQTIHPYTQAPDDLGF